MDHFRNPGNVVADSGAELHLCYRDSEPGRFHISKLSHPWGRAPRILAMRLVQAMSLRPKAELQIVFGRPMDVFPIAGLVGQKWIHAGRFSPPISRKSQARAKESVRSTVDTETESSVAACSWVRPTK